MRMRIKEFAELTGVSVRTLRYYDELGLLKPAAVDRGTGYRFYDEESLLRMEEILFYRELDFPLKHIHKLLTSPNYNKQKALEDQKTLLILKKQRLERLIAAVDGAMKGEIIMNAFDNSRFEQYKAEAKQRWGDTEAYQEYAEKTARHAEGQERDAAAGLDAVMGEFALCMKRGAAPGSGEARAMVKKLQAYITDNFYTCTDQILAGLGQMYVADERFKANIDRHAPGTAEYVRQAIELVCGG